MATQVDYQRLRMDIGLQADDTTSLSDPQADAIFVEAAELYSDSASQTAYTRILALERLMAQAALRTDYTQNETSEKASQIFDHYALLLKRWQDKFAVAILALSGGARFGKPSRKPARIKEFPDTWGGW